MQFGTVETVTNEDFERDIKATLERCIEKVGDSLFSEDEIGQTANGFYIAKNIEGQSQDLYLNKSGNVNVTCEEDTFKTKEEALRALIKYNDEV
ncbi:hypothetical protein [Poseidonibacter ostreae]|uniref:Uncharacterized protein n=1 Tax=Poseidonibacter ostreae TaxID=2654171 RepID=A0A6L4WX38_9BACT|nr:hypothetical protein [Poseidonibacter ostreae]KAB7891415.1 hypothetical protein GBG19_00840 [Poseidonibacter ostreae]